MKTIMIYDQLMEQPIKFLVLDGDYSRLNGIYINQWYDDEEKETKEALMDELSDLIYNRETGQEHIEFLDSFPVYAVESDTIVIVAGFLP